jgi:hypothetical protein
LISDRETVRHHLIVIISIYLTCVRSFFLRQPPFYPPPLSLFGAPVFEAIRIPKANIPGNGLPYFSPHPVIPS